MEGVVKSFDKKRGFGFIERSGGPDIFFHYSQIVSEKSFKEVCPGNRVRFEIDENFGNPKALEVRVLD